MRASIRLCRPTTAGEEPGSLVCALLITTLRSASTSRQSGKSSWREEWTPGIKAGLELCWTWACQGDASQVGDATRAVPLHFWKARADPWQPQPPPPPSEPLAADPEFSMALKRASESASAKSAAAPALGHRRWSRAVEAMGCDGADGEDKRASQSSMAEAPSSSAPGGASPKRAGNGHGLSRGESAGPV